MADPETIRTHATKLDGIVEELLALNVSERGSVPGEIIEVLRHCATEMKSHAITVERDRSSGETSPETARDAR